MPGYAGAGQATLLHVNTQKYMWVGENPPVNSYPGSLSLAYQLERIDNAFYPWGAGFEAYFGGNPGVFEIDIIGASIDQPQNYSYLGMINASTSYVSGYYVGRWDMPSNIWVRYVCAYLKTLTNLVPITLQVTR